MRGKNEGTSCKIKAVVVLSGGQDSATALALAARRHGEDRVAAITFEYGQRHSLETKYARRLAKHFGIACHKVVKLDFFKDLTSSALLDGNAKIEKKKNASCPTTVVEGRNSVFLTCAGIWAKSLGADEIWTGVSEADYSGYPDCRESFIKAQEKTMRLAMEHPFKIVTPFMHKTKKDEWATADALGILDLVRNETLTCYKGVPGSGCGRCPACRLRNSALRAYLKESKSTANASKIPSPR
ncbi:MAG: 7-cyano-7-deazaguanine synthase QueC [Kiritimatiellae bacterium]|nr:7-cyano-7-deazaguanine synthase QueC [Kiritimatiellia bacterium]